MTTEMLDRPMARTGRPKKPGGEGTLVRIDSDIVSRARYLSAQLDTPMSELLSGILRTEIDRQFREVTRKVLEAEEGAGRAPGDAGQGEAADETPKAPKKKRKPKGTGE